MQKMVMSAERCSPCKHGNLLRRNKERSLQRTRFKMKVVFLIVIACLIEIPLFHIS